MDNYCRTVQFLVESWFSPLVGRVLSFVDCEALGDVQIGTFVIEETEIALASEVEGLSIATRILQDCRKRNDSV